MIIIREETAADIDAISAVTRSAFANLAISQQTEHLIIRSLRAAKALAVSLVAECDGRVIGHVAFSRVAISDGSPDWYGLGPLSVLPEMQRQGVGKELVGQGLSRLRKVGAAGCCLVGDPQYYERFGFRSQTGLIYEGVPEPYFMALPFGSAIPQGTVEFHTAFSITS